ncbi:MAG: PilZ domain-containing protein [Acidobacteriaceae bacterium]|nr:PilZ domain-containing protein [Acidobacteriaceae bacterium]
MYSETQISENRREERIAAPAMVRITWRDRFGEDKFANVRSQDVSISGMRVELPEEVPPRSYVTLQSPQLGLHGTASVRFCRAAKGRYVTGLEFTGGLKWKPKQAAKKYA